MGLVLSLAPDAVVPVARTAVGVAHPDLGEAEVRRLGLIGSGVL